MILIPILALIVGIALASGIHPVTGDAGRYLAVACLAGVDTICGGIRSGLEGKFHAGIFMTGFFSNILIAFGLAWLGEKLFIDLTLAVALVLGARIFTNLSLIRRYFLTRLKDQQDYRRLQRNATATAQSTATISQAETATNP